MTAKVLTAVLLATAVTSSVHYLKYGREISASPAKQNYCVVDETVWEHARPDLADLRIYSGEREVPYDLIIERGRPDNEHKDVRVLQQSTIGGKTQFVVDMEGVAEYDHIDLKLSTRNFVAHATVEGQDDLHAPRWAMLGDSIIYDLSKEGLGENSMLRLPRSAYRYLRVTVDGPVKPAEVLGASSEVRQEQKEVLRDLSSKASQAQEGSNTVFTFSVPENVPVERVHFTIDAAQPNFRRDVDVENEKKVSLGSGEINRVHLVRNGNKIDSEVHALNFTALGQKTVRVIVHNGDDPPLKIADARLQQYERRAYFNPADSAQKFYYGDEKLQSPVYDYAKLFQKDPTAALAQLGPEQLNSAFTGRPDDRPWSERHPVVLWTAIIAAVLLLGSIALRSMKAA